MLELGIDEYTLVLQINQSIKNTMPEFEWAYVAENIIDRFAEKADLIAVFGEKLIEDKEMRIRMSNCSQDNLSVFSKQQITKEWLHLINKL